MEPLTTLPAHLVAGTALAACLGVTPALGRALDPPTGMSGFERYTTELRALARDHDGVAVRSIGTTFEGRDLWLVTLGEEAPHKPVLYVDAGHVGAEPTAAEVTRRALVHLLSRTDADTLARVLGACAIEFLPRLNPDGLERLFSEGRLQPLVPRPIDDDRDGRIDEDGPDDLDGDGEIASMRVPDAAGSWVADPADARLLVRREAADDGPFFRLYEEGLDDDRDGLVNEDGEGGVSLLNNFPQGWEIASDSLRSGPYATSERETVALVEHFLDEPEIWAVVSASGAHRPERAGTNGGEAFRPEDARVFKRLEARLEKRRGRPLDTEFKSPGTARIGGAGELGPSPPRGSKAPPLVRAVVPGSFVEWAFYQTGAFAFAPQVWVMPPEQPKAAADTSDGSKKEKKETRDRAGEAWLAWGTSSGRSVFHDWTPYEHPTLGRVEIGGFRSAPRTIAPEAALDSLAADLAGFVLEVAAQAPRIEIASSGSTSLGAGLHRISVVVANAGETPTLSMMGSNSGYHHAVLAELDGGSTVTLVDNPARVGIGRLAPGERRVVEWIVRGEPGASARITAWGVRSGEAHTTVRLGDAGRRP